MNVNRNPLLLCLLLFITSSISGQAYVDATFDTEKSDLWNKLNSAVLEKKLSEPDIQVSEFNRILFEIGIDYEFKLSTQSCSSIKLLESDPKRKDPIQIKREFLSFEGDRTILKTTEFEFTAAPCGYCYTLMPIFTINQKHFVTPVRGIPVQYYTPENLELNIVNLVDPNDFTKVIKSWIVPYKAEPKAISDDRAMIFLDVPSGVSNSVVLTVSDNGGSQFYKRENLQLERPENKPTVLQEGGGSKKRVISFGKKETQSVLSFDPAC